MSAADRDAWCRQIGSPPFAADLRGPLTGAGLQQCTRDDLFLTLGACDREAAIHGASVKHVSQSGEDAVARLLSGVSIDLQRVGGQWLVQDIGGTAVGHVAQLTSGPCAGA